MTQIHVLKHFEFADRFTHEKDIEVREIFDGARRRLVEIDLQNRAVLKKHKASEPTTVFCLAGKGVFRAGANLEEEHTMTAGTLITLESSVEHEVAARPALRLLVTKFKEF